jgi:hypothetical protein
VYRLLKNLVHDQKSCWKRRKEKEVKEGVISDRAFASGYSYSA